MKKFFPLLLLSTLTACGPTEGPLGLHVGDKVKAPLIDGLQELFDAKDKSGGYDVVTRVGRDWVEFNNSSHRYTAQHIEGYLIVCPHENE